MSVARRKSGGRCKDGVIAAVRMVPFVVLNDMF